MGRHNETWDWRERRSSISGPVQLLKRLSGTWWMETKTKEDTIKVNVLLLICKRME